MRAVSRVHNTTGGVLADHVKLTHRLLCRRARPRSHDDHLHPTSTLNKCSDRDQTVDEAAHDLYVDDIYWNIEAQYEDRGNSPASPTRAVQAVSAFNRMVQGGHSRHLLQ